MRRATPSLAVAVVALLALPSLSAAGWRSHDRPDGNEQAVEEPCQLDHDGGRSGTDARDDAEWNAPPGQVVEPGWQGAPGNVDRQWHGQGRAHHGSRHIDTIPSQATQPYWGTMRPYWNSPEPPGVIHRQPRTAPLKTDKRR
jgi:hypothetical protein